MDYYLWNMEAKKNVVCCFLLSIGISMITSAKVKVAVYEHVVISPDDPEALFTRQEAFQWMSKNLNVFVEQARKASEQGAKIIVFPEYGITGFDHSRNSIVPFLEDIPDSSTDWNPCMEPDRFADTLVLRNLSCTAQMYKIYIVANMGDMKTCDKMTDETCPHDGRYQFNTNVIFDNNGQLVARYHKLHMYDETPLFDPAPNAEHVYFDTPFGRFGTIVCFDIMQNEPTQVLLNKYSITNLLVTSAWNVFLPFIIPQQMYSGLAKKSGINVIASNIRNSLYQMAGSGIFGNDIQSLSDVNSNGAEGILLVSEIETEEAKIYAPNTIMSINSSGKVKQFINKTYEGTYRFGLNMSYAIMEGQSGIVTSCKDDVCCVVTYQFKSRDENETIILSVVDELLYKPGIIHMQYCAVFKCSPHTIYSCDYDDIFVINSIFADIKIQGYFDNGVTFPLVTTIDNNELTMDMDKYTFDDKNAILHSNQFENPLLAAVVYNTLHLDVIKTGASSNVAQGTTLSLSTFLLIYIYKAS
ncbi:pantetheinase-like isoform X2 [Ruditapes philippinarum]|uniref:pantetheinase-like isoform X2 n=1 Tax=Ruditapes philippinarum TaxID=129788 RepID=UPI00295BCA1B|nr:pantetheinase-like isoform X2 [Ruditapes philippinarum]